MKALYKIAALALLSATASLTGCKKDAPTDNGNAPTGTITNIEQMVVPNNFNYATTYVANVDVILTDGEGTPFTGTKVSLYDGQLEPGLHPKLLFTGFTGADGRLQAPVSLPTYIKEVVVYPFSIGIPNNVVVPVSGNSIKFHFTKGAIQSMYSRPANNSFSTNANFSRKAGIADKFSKKLGTWNSSGVPNYLVGQRDVLTTTFLNNITASFPESKPVPVNHPDYLLESNERNLHITELSDVWITFVHEGAGYKNALLYYVYHKDSVPTSTNNIDSLYIVFPNASFNGSGGGLYAGDKVKLGRFKKDYVIAFAVAADGYNSGTQKVGAGQNVWFTDKSLNNEAAAYKQHSALLHDGDNNRFIIAFEDLKRDNFSSDEDFNDVIFFATSNPVTAIDDTNVPPIDKPGDCDGDGVSDVYDDYPCDATKAYNRYFPSATEYGTVAFEDLWPYTGDYDMNDLVMRWQFLAVANAQNKVIELNCKAYAAAKGGSLQVGFGIEFPFNATAVSAATGSQITRNRVSLAANGLENGHTKAVLILFDDAADQLTHPGGSFFNTVPNSGIALPDTINTKITFTSPISFTTLGDYPFNPFIFTTDRGTEMHLPDHANTAKANTNLFNTGKDNSNPTANRYYKTAGNLPWALHLPVEFDYPVEKKAIIEAYTKFADWAQSGGTTSTSWYLNEEGNRNATNIFTR